MTEKAKVTAKAKAMMTTKTMNWEMKMTKTMRKKTIATHLLQRQMTRLEYEPSKLKTKNKSKAP